MDCSLRVVDASRAVTLQVTSGAEVTSWSVSRTGFARFGDDLLCQSLAVVTSYFQPDAHDARWGFFWFDGVAKSVVLFSCITVFWVG